MKRVWTTGGSAIDVLDESEVARLLSGDSLLMNPGSVSIRTDALGSTERLVLLRQECARLRAWNAALEQDNTLLRAIVDIQPEHCAWLAGFAERLRRAATPTLTVGPDERI